MKHVSRVLGIYATKVVVQSFLFAFMACAIWWMQILPRDEDHKWDAFVGVVAAVVAVLLEQLAEVISHYRKFYQLDGQYKCRGFASENHSEACRALNIDTDELDKRLADNPDLTYPNKAQATIEYMGGTVLNIILQEGTHNNEWRGDCIMESDSVGIVAWAYKKLGKRADPWTRNGIKRLTVVDRDRPLKICLHSYNNDGRFGREMMIWSGNRAAQHVSDLPSGWRRSLALICGSLLILTILTVYG